jgi:cobalamin-dependent methionine synthase I
VRESIVIIIGEKINASRPGVSSIIQQRDRERLLELARTQAAAGAAFIDVNVGTGVGSRQDEMLAMEWAIQTIQEDVDTPLCVDSADPGVVEAGLKKRNGRPSLINSTKADEGSLEQVVPLARAYDAQLIGLAMDKAGIPETVEGRLRACEKIADACEKHGLSTESLFFDPLVLPVSTDVRQGLVTLNTIGEVKKKFHGAKTVAGLSNVSFGLPGRGRLNKAFLCMAIYAGLDAAILDPLDKGLTDAITIGEVLVGKDRHCRRYTRAFRK